MIWRIFFGKKSFFVEFLDWIFAKIFDKKQKIAFFGGFILADK